jgi:RsiW-degrading membrane proteinase PrsW (M82 family)
MISFAAPNYPAAPARATGPLPHREHTTAMTQSTRKLIGTFLVIASIFVYAAIVMWLYMSFLAGQPWWLLIAFFAVTGVSWFFPATWIIRWMSRPDA